MGEENKKIIEIRNCSDLDNANYSKLNNTIPTNINFKTVLVSREVYENMLDSTRANDTICPETYLRALEPRELVKTMIKMAKDDGAQSFPFYVQHFLGGAVAFDSEELDFLFD